MDIEWQPWNLDKNVLFILAHLSHRVKVSFVPCLSSVVNIFFFKQHWRECSGSVVECLTRDRRAAGSSHTGVTVLCP